MNSPKFNVGDKIRFFDSNDGICCGTISFVGFTKETIQYGVNMVNEQFLICKEKSIIDKY